MKTFKLKLLEIVQDDQDSYQTIQIPLHDGLIINQEDEENTWMMEAYTNGDLYDYFAEIEDKEQTLIIHVKITTELNEKATCFVKIADLNKVNDKISVLFSGPMLKQRTEKIEEILEELMNEGYRKEDLINHFKEIYNHFDFRTS